MAAGDMDPVCNYPYCLSFSEMSVPTSHQDVKNLPNLLATERKKGTTKWL